MSEFPLIEKYLIERANPPAEERSYAIRLGWIRKLDGREITMYGWFTKFEHGECQKSNQPNLAAPMTEQLAKKVLHRVLSKYPKSTIEESLSYDQTKTDLHQVGFVDSLEAVRDSIRNAIADGFSHAEILTVATACVSRET
jgi:hypothetical protein